ncbi:MAG: hypothetical protein ACYCTG_04965 [Ferrimicrobium sp.]
MPATRSQVQRIWDIVPDEHCTPDGIIEYYESLPKRDGVRQSITKRAKAAVDAYLRYVIAKEPRTVVRRPPRAELSERSKQRIATLQKLLEQDNLDIMTRLAYQAEIIAASQRQPRTPGATQTPLTEDEIAEIKQEFYLVAKFYMAHHGWSPQALANIGVPHSELAKAALPL